MGVYVYGRRSRYQDFLNIKYTCETVAEGNTVCESNYEPDPKRRKTDPSSTAESAPQPPQCGASCLNNAECDVANGCVCDTDFTSPPTDPSYGMSKCRYRPNASTLIAAAASLIKIGSCRGRCLMGADGTLQLPVDDTVPIAAPAANIDPLYPGSPPGTLEPSLTCPCNCTYVSHACCLSPDGIVKEDPTQKIQTSLKVPNNTVCCDGTTGDWTSAPVQRDYAVTDIMCPPAKPGYSGSGSINSRKLRIV